MQVFISSNSVTVRANTQNSAWIHEREKMTRELDKETAEALKKKKRYAAVTRKLTMRLHFAQTAAGSGHWYPSASWQMHPWCEFQKSYIGLFSSYCIHFQKTWPLTSNPVVWVTDLKSAEIISRNACGINFKILGNFLLESSNSQTWVTTIPYMSSLIELYVANNNRSLQKKEKKRNITSKMLPGCYTLPVRSSTSGAI